MKIDDSTTLCPPPAGVSPEVYQQIGHLTRLLHDTLEDTEVTTQELQKGFGAKVTALVEGVTKVQRLEKTFDKRVRNMESVRKMFRTMGEDIRVQGAKDDVWR